MFGEAEWKNLQLMYKSVLSDTLQSKNLQTNLDEVTKAITELDEIIKKERLTGKPTPSLDDIKNDFYYLKYEILERI